MQYWSITAVSAVMLWSVPFAGAFAQGQQGSGSPYSAYGLGDLVGSTQVSQALMGGTGVALADPFSVIRVNPASYASLGMTAFETGVLIRSRRFETESGSANGDRLDLLGLSIGLPFGNGRWGMAFGLNPTSQVGYRITDVQQLPDDEGSVTFEYLGNGGLNRAFLGFGHRFWLGKGENKSASSLAIGANFNYQFGRIEEVRRAVFPRNLNHFNVGVVSTLDLRSPGWDVGVQYTGTLFGEERAKTMARERQQRKMDKDRAEQEEWITQGKDPEKRKAYRPPSRDALPLKFRLGADLEWDARLSAKRTEFVYSYTRSISGLETVVDTIRQSEGKVGEIGVPLQLAVGAAVFNDRWMATLEYRVRDWARIKLDVEGFDLGDRLTVSSGLLAGASYRPAGGGSGTFLQNTIYRAGVRYAQDYLTIAGSELSEIGMSFGMSLPLLASQTRSRFSFGAEFGEYGTTGSGLIRERFTNFYVGITITPELRDRQNWLKKRQIE